MTYKSKYYISTIQKKKTHIKFTSMDQSHTDRVRILGDITDKTMHKQKP